MSGMSHPRRSSRMCLLTGAWSLPAALAMAFALTAACTDPAELRYFPSLNVPFNLPTTAVPTLELGSPVHTEEDIFTDIPGKAGHHAATIAALTDGRIVAAWYAYDGPGELDGAEILTATRRPDEAGWSAPMLLVSRNRDVGNPVLFSENGDLCLFYAVAPIGWSSAHIEFQRSTDLGQTWSAPRSINGPLGSNVRYPPIRLRDRRLLLPAYDDLFKRTLFFISDDGENWRLQPIVTGDDDARPIQPSVVELASGRLLAVMRNTTGNWLWIMASDDTAMTWSHPADSGFSNPGSAAVMHRLANQHLVLVFNDSPIERRPLTIALSTDDGRTWPYRRVLADGPESYSYPSVTQSPDGLIHVVFSLARRTIRHAAFNEAWIAR